MSTQHEALRLAAVWTPLERGVRQHLGGEPAMPIKPENKARYPKDWKDA